MILFYREQFCFVPLRVSFLLYGVRMEGDGSNIKTDKFVLIVEIVEVSTIVHPRLLDYTCNCFKFTLLHNGICVCIYVVHVCECIMYKSFLIILTHIMSLLIEQLKFKLPVFFFDIIMN